MAEITEVRVSPTLITVTYDDGYERIVNRKHANRVNDLSRVLFHLGKDPGNPLDRSDVGPDPLGEKALKAARERWAKAIDGYTDAYVKSSSQSNRKLSSGRVREAIEDLSDGEKADLYKSLCFAYQDKMRSLPPEDDRSEGPCIREGRLDRT